MTASCRRRSRRSATPRRPTRRSSSPSTRWTSRTPIRTACVRNCSATRSWSRKWAAKRRTCRFRRLKRTGLDKLIEAILLQAEILDLKANPHRSAEGTVIESRLDRGRGPVGTRAGAARHPACRATSSSPAPNGAACARCWTTRASRWPTAEPSTPVEILGLSGAPSAGEPFVVVENESRAREITEFRERRQREKAAGAAAGARGTLDQMLARIQAGEQKEVAVLIKADVQGSAEAIQVVVAKLAHEEVKVRVLLAGVGQITESDMQLAKASSAVVIAFNVRATSQARELAQRESVDIRYFSIIYEVADDVEKLVKGKVAPKAREKFLGYAEVRKVFNITKTGKVAGCYDHRGPRQARRRRARAARQRGDPHRRTLATQALQGRRPRSRPRLRMRPVVRPLRGSAGRRRRRVLRDGDGPGLKKSSQDRRVQGGPIPAAVARGGGNPPRAVGDFRTRRIPRSRSRRRPRSPSPKFGSAPT